MINRDRLRRASQQSRANLLAERNADGHWIGELSTSALSTATAVSALSLFEQHRSGDDESHAQFPSDQVRHLIEGGVAYLTGHQNADGGWGDTDRSYSNVATSMLAVAALQLAGGDQEFRGSIDLANKYIDELGRVEALRRRYGVDKTFAVPILTNCALAGLVPWKSVSPLPFELACLPQAFYRFVRLPVVSYAIPALVAIGQARYFHRPPWNPIARLVRHFSVRRSLSVLRRMQPDSGGYLEAVPLTSFVVMSLAATGRCHEQVTRQGIKFLFESIRPDGSWPIDTNLATWNTTLSINALAAAGEDVGQYDCLPWILSCQTRARHPFTGADPGGWGWSDLSGAVPDADDTPGAMLALRHFHRSAGVSNETKEEIEAAVREGANWLLGLQNRDGGWPTFCRGWGKLPFDRSGSDLTAHAVRALTVWRCLDLPDVERALQRGFSYLEATQRADGSWLPLWFGNQDHPDEENPVYGTAKVLLAYQQTGRLETRPAERGLLYLSNSNNADGGWGGGPGGSSIEETALAVEALTPALAGSAGGNTGEEQGAALRSACVNGLEWLCQQVEDGQSGENSPIGFYFAKLWYYERLYPLIFTASALGQAAHLLATPTAPKATKSDQACQP